MAHRLLWLPSGWDSLGCSLPRSHHLFGILEQPFGCALAWSNRCLIVIAHCLQIWRFFTLRLLCSNILNGWIDMVRWTDYKVFSRRTLNIVGVRPCSLVGSIDTCNDDSVFNALVQIWSWSSHYTLVTTDLSMRCQSCRDHSCHKAWGHWGRDTCWWMLNIWGTWLFGHFVLKTLLFHTKFLCFHNLGTSRRLIEAVRYHLAFKLWLLDRGCFYFFLDSISLHDIVNWTSGHRRGAHVRRTADQVLRLFTLLDNSGRDWPAGLLRIVRGRTYQFVHEAFRLYVVVHRLSRVYYIWSLRMESSWIGLQCLVGLLPCISVFNCLGVTLIFVQ